MDKLCIENVARQEEERLTNSLSLSLSLPAALSLSHSVCVEGIINNKLISLFSGKGTKYRAMVNLAVHLFIIVSLLLDFRVEEQ